MGQGGRVLPLHIGVGVGIGIGIDKAMLLPFDSDTNTDPEMLNLAEATNARDALFGFEAPPPIRLTNNTLAAK